MTDGPPASGLTDAGLTAVSLTAASLTEIVQFAYEIILRSNHKPPKHFPFFCVPKTPIVLTDYSRQPARAAVSEAAVNEPKG